MTISSKSTTFGYTDRGSKDITVFAPGWATDCAIFGMLDLKCNSFMAVDFNPFDFEAGLLAALGAYDIQRVSLFGLSLGGFAAAEFASRHPDLVDELTLVGIREAYSEEETTQIKDRLKRNRTAYLYKFYTSCFSGKEEMAWFKRTLFRDYCGKLDIGYLLMTLEYLERTRLTPGMLTDIKNVKIIHGENDTIAPIREAIGIKEGLAGATFICVESAGHIPFLNKRFSGYI